MLNPRVRHLTKDTSLKMTNLAYRIGQAPTGALDQQEFHKKRTDLLQKWFDNNLYDPVCTWSQISSEKKIQMVCVSLS